MKEIPKYRGGRVRYEDVRVLALEGYCCPVQASDETDRELLIEMLDYLARGGVYWLKAQAEEEERLAKYDFIQTSRFYFGAAHADSEAAARLAEKLGLACSLTRADERRKNFAYCQAVPAGLRSGQGLVDFGRQAA